MLSPESYATVNLSIYTSNVPLLFSSFESQKEDEEEEDEEQDKHKTCLAVLRLREPKRQGGGGGPIQKQKGKKEEEDDVWKEEYTIAVRNILFTNVSLGKPNGKQFWFRVKEHLVELFPEIVELSASEIRTQWTSRSQDSIRNPEEKKNKKEEKNLRIALQFAEKKKLKKRRKKRKMNENMKT